MQDINWREKIGSFYTKKSVFGDNPLKEIIYELEDAYEYDSFFEEEYISKSKLQDIIVRHDNTIKEFKIRLSKIIN